MLTVLAIRIAAQCVQQFTYQTTTSPATPYGLFLFQKALPPTGGLPAPCSLSNPRQTALAIPNTLDDMACSSYELL